MRACVAVAFMCALGLCAGTDVRASGFDVPALALRTDTLVIASSLADGSRDIAALDAGAAEDAHGVRPAKTWVVPERYAFAFDDTRAFWFAAGASAGISLGTHVLVGLPVGVFSSVLLLGIAAANPVVAVPLAMGVGGGYILLHAVGAGLASTFVFNGMSDIYEGNPLPAIAGHLAGDILAFGVSAVMFGAGGMLIGGITGLAVFTGSAGLETVLILSVLGALPAVVIGGAAFVVAPAILGAWALALSAKPTEAYAPAPDWKSPAYEGSSFSSFSSSRDARALPILAVPLGAPSL